MASASHSRTSRDRRNASRSAAEAALRGLVHAVAETTELDRLAQLAAEAACLTAHGSGAYIERVHSVEGGIEVVAAAGQGTPPVGTNAPYPGSLTDEVIKRGTPEALADITAIGVHMAPYLLPTCQGCLGLVVPLLNGTDAVGSLVVLRAADQGAFRDEDIDRAVTVGDVTSIAMRRVLTEAQERRTEEALRMNERRQTILADTGRLLEAGTSVQTTLERLARLFVQWLCDWCVIYQPHDHGARRVALAGREPDTEVMVRAAIGETLAESSDLPMIRVLRTGKSLLMAHVPASTLEGASAGSAAYQRILREHPPQSIVAVPLTGRGRTLAAAGLVSTDPARVFGADDLALAQEVADRAALALDNAQLYEQAARRAKQEAVLRRAMAAVTAKLELADVAREIASNALVVIDAAGAFVERVDRSDGRVTVVAAAGDLVPAEGTSAAYEGSLAQEVIRVGEAERIRDVGAPGERVPKVLATTYDRGPALVVPMLRQETVGALFFLRPSGAPTFDDDDVERAGIFGELAGLALRKAHLLEIAEQRRLEAEAATRARDEMLAIVAHDLRNPVHTVAMAADLLSDPAIRLSEEQRRQHQQIIARSARRMNRLIRDLLDAGQIEAGRLAVKCEVTDVSRVTADVCDAFQPIAEERRLRFRCVSESQIPHIDADRDRIMQVLGNYLDNAVKFSPAGGEIVLRVAPDPDTPGVRFSVCDEGPGIAPEALPRVFERYWQERSTAHKGAGLGLAIAKGIAEAHGGRVWAESSLGQGSTFNLWLPKSAHSTDRSAAFD